MKIQVEKSNCVVVQRQSLTDALKKLSLVISAKSNIEIFQAVKFEITKNSIVLTATDADTTAIVSMQNDYNCSPQSFVIGHKKLTDFLKKSKAQTIEFEKLDADMINVQSSKVNFKLQGYNPYDYPTLPVIDFDYLELDVNEFKNAMKNTLFACSTSDSRPILQSVNITYNKNHLQFVATDSHRLGQYTFNNYRAIGDKEIKGNPCGAVLSKVTKLIGKNTKVVTMGFSRDVTLFKFDDVQFYLRNYEGNYPDTSRLLPENFSTEMNLNSMELLESVAMLKIVASDDRNGVIRLDTCKNNKTVLYADNTLKEKIESELTVDNFNGDDLRISFNNRYFTDAINALDAHDIHVQFVGAMRPFLMKNTQDDKAVQLILPVRTY